VDDRFFNSFLPPTIKICGTELSSFTLWNHLALSAINSPMAVGGDSISVPDLLLAVRTCALNYGESNIKPRLRDVRWRIKLSRNTRLFRKETEKFYKWMELQSSPPIFYRGGTSGDINKGIERGSRCLGLACSLMYRGGLTESEAWNCTLGKAMWMDAQFAKLEGMELRFMDDEDLVEDAVDLSNLTDSEALEKFTAELPAGLVQATYKHWIDNIKKKEGSE